MATDEQTSFDESDLISLGEKLAALDLTDPERAALGALISDDDVVGFGRFDVAGGIRAGIRKGGKRFSLPGQDADIGIRAQGLRAQPIIGGGLPKPGRF